MPSLLTNVWEILNLLSGDLNLHPMQILCTKLRYSALYKLHAIVLMKTKYIATLDTSYLFVIHGFIIVVHHDSFTDKYFLISMGGKFSLPALSVRVRFQSGSVSILR